LYSATKNGETKCGECYSNAISVSAAKADCLAKLERFGYANITVLAIEAGDPDCAKIQNSDIEQNRFQQVDEAEESDDGSDDSSDDSSDDAGDDTDDTGSDDFSSDDTGSDDFSGDDTDDDTGSDDTESDDTESDDTGDDTSSDDTGDDTESDDTGDNTEDKGEDDTDDDEELSDEEKAQLKDEYKTKFQEIMIACGFEDRSFIDLTIPEKTRFFEKMNAQWDKADPTKFMSEDEQNQLESITVTVK